MRSKNASSLLPATAVALLLLAGRASSAAEGEAEGADFAAEIVGDWTGTGVVYGNDVTLTRSWRPELGGRFLQADMGVQMANGASFRVLAYWKPAGEGRYRVVWLDESGKLEEYEALADTTGRAVSIHYLHTGRTDGEPAAWRRLTYRLTGPDSYEERVAGAAADGWTELALFRFERRK